MFRHVDECFEVLEKSLLLPASSNDLNNLSKDSSLLGDNGVKGREDKLHKVPIAIQVFNDIHKHVDVGL